MNDDNHIFLVTQKDMQTEHAKQEDVYTVGVVAEIKQIVKMQNQVVRVIGGIETKGRNWPIFIEKEEFLKAQGCAGRERKCRSSCHRKWRSDAAASA